MTEQHELVQLRGGLPLFKERLDRGLPITVAYLGGSITEGAGASDADTSSWRALTDRWLKQSFPGSVPTGINAGVGGTTSTFGAHRLQEHVLSQGEINLLMIEFSVNDGEDRMESIRGMEGIVRQCRRLSPRTELLFVYTAADKNLMEPMPFNISVHEEIASYYGIPSVHIAGEVYRRIQAGELVWRELAPDGVHPNDEGHALYAHHVQSFLQQVILSVNSREGLAARDLLLPIDPPPPLDPLCGEFASMSSFRSDGPLQGFTIRRLEREPLMNWRFDTEHGYAEGSGSETFSFVTEGRRAGVVLLHGPDSGIFEYSYDGETFCEVDLFDDWCLGAYRPVLAMFPYQQERGPLHVTIRCTGRRNVQSKGTTIRILKLLSD